jgi:hypothetical protein
VADKNTTTNQKLAFVGEGGHGEGMQPRWNVWGGCYHIVCGRKQRDEKVNKIKIWCGLRCPPYNIVHTTINKKHTGATKKLQGKD